MKTIYNVVTFLAALVVISCGALLYLSSQRYVDEGGWY